MYRPAFTCQWINADGVACVRMAQRSTGYCSWHLMADRLAQLWDPLVRPNVQTRRQEYADVIGIAVILAYALTLFGFARQHFTVLLSGEAPGREAVYNPAFALLFLGTGLILLGKLLSIVRDATLPSWFARFRVVWCGLFWGLGFTLLQLPEPYVLNPRVQSVLNLCLFLPFGLILHGLERSGGRLSPILVLTGVGIIFLAGLCNPVMELLYLFTGHFNYLGYLGSVTPEVHSFYASVSIVNGFAYCAVAIDAAVALGVRGSMLTLFAPASRPSPRPFAGLRTPDSWRGRWRRVLDVSTVLFLLYGQAHLLRHMLLPVFRSYPFDILNLPLPPSPFAVPTVYLLAVIGLHYVFSRRRPSGGLSPDVR